MTFPHALLVPGVSRVIRHGDVDVLQALDRAARRGQSLQRFLGTVRRHPDCWVPSLFWKGRDRVPVRQHSRKRPSSLTIGRGG